MEASVDSTDSRGRKRVIRLVAGLFFALLVGLTLFSRTLFALTLPKVTTEQPAAGSLNPAFEGEAVLNAASELDLSNPAGGKVTQVLVQAGDAVRKGQVLVRYENADSEQGLEAERTALRKLKVPLPSLQRAYIEAARGDDPAAQNDARIALESANIDINAQEKRIAALQRQAAELQELNAPFDGVVEAVNAIEGLPSGAGAAADIRLANADKGLRFELQVPAYAAAMLDVNDAVEVTVAGGDGRAVQGDVLAIGDIGASEAAVGVTGATSPGKAAVGDIAVSGQDEAVPDRLRLLVGLHDKQLRAGERVKLVLAARGNADGKIVSSQAIHQDLDGAYVFVLHASQGPLGNTKVARKTPVTVIGVSGTRTAISDGLFGDEAVILESGEPLADGVQVRT